MINPFLTNIFKIELSEEDKQKRHTSPYLFQTPEEMERIRSNTIVEFVVNGEIIEIPLYQDSSFDIINDLINPQIGISTTGYGSLVDNEININMLTMYGSPPAQDIPFKCLVDRNILLQIKCDVNPFITSYIGQDR